MTEAPEAPSPEDVVRGRLTALVRQAYELRSFKRPPADAAPAVVHEALVRLRTDLDVLENCMIQVSLIRQATESEQKAAEEEAQDAWDRQADAEYRRGVRRDFEGAEERYARWRLATFEQQRVARQSRARADLARQSEIAVRTVYRGMNGIREELLASLRYLQWESAMER